MSVTKQPFASFDSNGNMISSSSTSSSSPAGTKKETIAIIGGGIAGLSFAKTIVDNSNGMLIPTVYDTGRLRPGGRCSSRLPGDIPKDNDGNSGEYTFLQSKYLDKVIIDHAAQILTMPSLSNENDDANDFFHKQILEWEKLGIITKYKDGTVCDICNPYNRRTKKYDKSKIQLRSKNSNNGSNMYYGTKGMGSIPSSIAKEAVEAANGDNNLFSLKQDVWVSPSNGVKYIKDSNNWQIKAKGRVLGEYDKIIIAHNGKCADRIMSTTPAKDVHQLLRVNFAPFVSKPRGPPKNNNNNNNNKDSSLPSVAGKMTLNSIYSLTFAMPSRSILSDALPTDQFTCGFIKNHPNLKFLSCQTRKYDINGNNNDGDDFEVWTILSSGKFGKTHKGPQENLPKNLIDKVTNLLLESLEQSLVLEEGSLRGEVLLESRLQLWGAAVPLNTWEPNKSKSKPSSGGFIYDSRYNVGVCGDWLLDPSIYGAWESGRRLANYIIEEKEEGNKVQSSSTVGLGDGIFKPSMNVDKVGIGSL